MARPVHYRTGDYTKSRELPVACNERGFSTPDTDQVTCIPCQRTLIYTEAANRHREVVEALAYPKEDHKCLPRQQP
jgi:hypothetical protein